jgi:hypothetical protein
MESKPSRHNPETGPEFEPQPADTPRNPVSERTQRALGRAATARTVQPPSPAPSERVRRALGRTAVDGAAEPSRAPTRGRG